MSLIFLLGEDAISWLLNDQFSTNSAAPLASPRAAEPGPGTRTITDTGNQLSISGSKLTSSAGAVSGYVDPRVVYESQSRVAGLSLIGEVSTASTAFTVIAFVNGTAGGQANAIAGLILGQSQIYLLRATITLIAVSTLGTAYKLCTVLESTGAFYFIKGGSQYPSWSLIFFDPINSTSTLYPTLTYLTNAGVRTFDDIRLRKLPAPFTAPSTLATLTQASPTTATSYTGDADGIQIVTFTSPGTLVDPSELRFRYQDASNYWTLYYDSAGALKLDSVVAGTPTNRINLAGQMPTNTTLTLAVSSYGTSHDVWSLSGTTWTKKGATVTVATPMDAVNAVRLAIGTGYTMTNLQSYARTSAARSAELDKV